MNIATNPQHTCTPCIINSSSSIIVLIVCGLPACGKTTLVQAFHQKYNHHPVPNQHDDPPKDEEEEKDHGNTTTTTTTTTSTTTMMVHSIIYDDIQTEILLQQQQQQELLEHETNIPTTTVIEQQEDDDEEEEEEIEDNDDEEDHPHFETTTTTTGAVLHAWRQTRRIAIQQLQQLLQDISSNTTTTNIVQPQQPQPNPQPHVILLDDNFYLRSMRKQIYRTCCNQDYDSMQMYFGTIYIDTPIETCLQRNHQRQTNHNNNNKSSDNNIDLHVMVTDDTIRRMHQRMEIPSIVTSNSMDTTTTTTTSSWDQAVLTVSTELLPNIHDQIQYIEQWIHHSTLLLQGQVQGTSLHTIATTTTNLNEIGKVPLLYRILPQCHPDFIDTTTTTIPTPLHERQMADLFWRNCVSHVAQHVSSSSQIQVANQVRKYCIQQLQQQEQQQRQTENHTIWNEATKKVLWWNMFVQGIGAPSSTTTTISSSSSSSTWLSEQEQKILYHEIFSNE